MASALDATRIRRFFSRRGAIVRRGLLRWGRLILSISTGRESRTTFRKPILRADLLASVEPLGNISSNSREKYYAPARVSMMMHALCHGQV